MNETETCGNPTCLTCLHGRTKGEQYRPHTMTPDCWCQDYKNDWVTPEALAANPKRCWMEKNFAPVPSGQPS